MSKRLFKPHMKTAMAILWFAFTFSMVAWWWIFFLLRMDSRRNSLEELQHSYRMFAWEGSILLAAILFGGISLVIFTYRDQTRHQRLRFFFSTFTHDIKTSIARLRLQAEVLEEEFEDHNLPVMKRLIQDIHRLDLQLENSLQLASLEHGVLRLEDVSLGELLSQLRTEFPELSIQLERNVLIHGDRRALLSLLKNVFQNAVLHGRASEISIQVRELGSSNVELRFNDNGLGFKGPLQKLGAEILKSQDSRSNGLGLLISKRLVQKMNGSLNFESKENAGFTAMVVLKGRIK